MPSTQLIVSGLSTLDEEELREALPDVLIEATHTRVPEGTLAEPATITLVMTLGSLAIAGVSAWASKGRRRKVSRLRYKIRKPDGHEVQVELDTNDSSEDVVKASVMAQLGQWLSPQASVPSAEG